MKKFLGYAILIAVAIVAILLMRGKFLYDTYGQILRENRAIIERVLVVCNNADGQDKVVDQSDTIVLDGDNWLNNYRDIVSTPESEEGKIEPELLDKMNEQLIPTLSDYRKFVEKYKSVLFPNSQLLNAIVDGWVEVFNLLGSSLHNDANDYRRKKKARAMMIIDGRLGQDSPRFLKNKRDAEIVVE
jgi:hypothetical protein